MSQVIGNNGIDRVLSEVSGSNTILSCSRKQLKDITLSLPHISDSRQGKKGIHRKHILPGEISLFYHFTDRD